MERVIVWTKTWPALCMARYSPNRLTSIAKAGPTLEAHR